MLFRSLCHVPLTAAYRSLSRPSSASCAKASTVCAYHLLFDGLVRTHTLRPGPSPPARSDAIFLKKENFSSLSRYAALRVRRGRALGTGHCAPGAARGKLQRDRAGSPAPHRPRGGVLPRKEVIQPHLPVRLPCYDFTPLTLHTFGASPPRGLGRRLRVQTTRVV